MEHGWFGKVRSFASGFPVLRGWRMSCDSLSKTLTPIRCSSVDSELMNAHDAAK